MRSPKPHPSQVHMHLYKEADVFIKSKSEIEFLPYIISYCFVLSLLSINASVADEQEIA